MTDQRHILIVDDEPHVIRVLELALERQGYSVDTAPNGAAALDRIRESAPDVLITDVQMPRMTGRELCETIAADMPARDFLIFVLTSRTEVEHREWTQKIPNLQFLEKPVSVRQLTADLDAYFQALGAA